MGVGVWNPDEGSRGEQLDEQVLARLLAVAASVEDEVTAEMLAEHDLSGQNGLMSHERADWTLAEPLTDDEIQSLIRFFTLIEMQVSGWDAGNKSPVIPLVKILRSRDAFDAGLRRWIKQTSNNRYLPNGSAL